jgi:Na+/proline symporter
MTKYDYAVLGFYFLYMLAISWFCRRFVNNVSDYFRSGGQVVWWMAGGSAFMVTFSAWTFTGAASRAYSDGWPITLIYVGNAIGFICGAFYFAPRLRQLRVITAMQAVRLRFGLANEQFFTWMTLILRLVYAGIWLYALGIFFSATFQIDVAWTVLSAGGTVILIALIGGSWAVVASDFIQVLILMPVTLVASVLAIVRLGGPAAFVHQLQPTHLNLDRGTTESFLGLWCMAMVVKQVIATNNLGETPRYFCVKDGVHAKKAALLAAVLMFFGIFIWFSPPMASAIVYPNLREVFPKLHNPADGSFFAIAKNTLPAGMLGLLVSGVFAATMSAMDAGLNNNAGIVIKNLYQPFVRPNASEKELLIAGKLATAVLGLLIVILAVSYSQLRSLSLFQLMLNFGIFVSLPPSMPLILCLFIRRTPRWSGWSTVLVGFAAGYLTWKYLTLRWAIKVFGETTTSGGWTKQNWDQAIAVLVVITVCTAWFWFSSLFYRLESDPYKESIRDFSETIEKPVHADEEEIGLATEDRQSGLIGWLCLPYGLVILLMGLIPNPPLGRLGFGFCGLVLIVIGLTLVRQSRRSHSS